MRPFLAIAAMLLSAAVALLVANCNSPASPTTSTLKTALGLKILVPSTIAPAHTAQLSAAVTYSDGTSQDVTATVQWRSSDTSILTISAAGLASGVQAGESNVTATLNPGVAATQTILVLPAGTFRLSGEIIGLGASVDGVLVQVTAGVGAGLSSSTVGGAYRLYGVAGDIQVTVTKSLWVPITQTVTVNSNTVLNFDLASVNPPPNLAGTYTLRITADPGCATTGDGALPAVGQQREYLAMIQEPGRITAISVALSGAHFLQSSKNSFDGWLTPNGASFDVNDPMYYYSGYRDVAELLSDGSVYLFSGGIDVMLSANDLVGTLNGTISVASDSSLSHTIGHCTSTHHVVTFTSQGGKSGRARRGR
jgi:hypothetical protein